MPKSNLVRDKTKEKALHFSANIEKYMLLREKSNDEVAAAIGMSTITFYKKKRNPSTFKLSEAIQTVRYLDFSSADRAEIF